MRTRPPIEGLRPRPGGELWDRKGAEWHIAAAEANWALCSHSMEAWNVEEREGRRGRGCLPAYCLMGKGFQFFGQDA